MCPYIYMYSRTPDFTRCYLTTSWVWGTENCVCLYITVRMQIVDFSTRLTIIFSGYSVCHFQFLASLSMLTSMHGQQARVWELPVKDPPQSSGFVLVQSSYKWLDEYKPFTPGQGGWLVKDVALQECQRWYRMPLSTLGTHTPDGCKWFIIHLLLYVAPLKTDKAPVCEELFFGVPFT